MKTRAKFNVAKIIGHVILILVTIICIVPFVVVISSSLTAENELVRNGYSLLIKNFSLGAYAYILDDSARFIRAYGLTIVTTVLGTVGAMVISTLLAYGMSIKGLPFVQGISFFVLFTLLFNGGTVPTYFMWTQVFHVKNTLIGLIVPRLLVSAFYIAIMRNYFRTSIPGELKESARIDGAGELRIFLKIVAPLSIPMIATIGLLIGVSYWNEWLNGLYYVSDTKWYTIQNLLNRMLKDTQFLMSNTAGTDATALAEVPGRAMKMAVAVIGALPIMVAFPFFQKYYVKGLSVGAVKG